MENTSDIMEKTIQKESWKPDFSKEIEQYLKTVLPGTRAQKPAKLFYDPLSCLSFLQAVSSFLFHWKPMYHENCISLSYLTNKLLGKHKSFVVDEGSVDYFRSELLNLMERGPLAVSNPAGKHDFFFTNAPNLPKMPLEFLPTMEQEILRRFNWGKFLGETNQGERLSQEGRKEVERTWQNMMDQYEQRVKEGLESLKRKNVSDPQAILGIVRRYVVEYLGTRSFSVIEPDNEPPFLNETLLGTATIHSICLSVLLEYLCLDKEKHGDTNLSSHPFMRLLTEMAQPNRGLLSTVGDLIWMDLFYSRWLNHKNEKRNGNFSSLPFILRNPVFILENIDPHLSSYPEDELAKNQMILFLCTCSSTFRKSLIEGIYSSNFQASQNSRPNQTLPLFFPPGILHLPSSLTQSLNHIIIFVLFSVLGVFVFKLIKRLSKQPLKKENPWKGHESAACWIEFLKNKVRSWINRFEPIQRSEENESVQNQPQIRQVRDYLEHVVKIWEAQTVRYGALCLREMKDPVDPPEIVRKNFNPAVLGYYEKELQELKWPIETLRAQSWFGTNALPIDFPRAAQSEYKALNRLGKDAKFMDTIKNKLGISDDYGLGEIQEESNE